MNLVTLYFVLVIYKVLVSSLRSKVSESENL